MVKPILNQKQQGSTTLPGGQQDTLSAESQLVMWQYGKLADMNREFDVAFWQAQSAEARLKAGWELVEFYHELKGLPKDELRLQRTVGTLQRQSG